MWNCKFYDSRSAIIIIDVDTGWSTNGSGITPALTDWSINWCWPLTQSSLGTLLFLWTHCSFNEFFWIPQNLPPYTGYTRHTKEVKLVCQVNKLSFMMTSLVFHCNINKEFYFDFLQLPKLRSNVPHCAKLAGIETERI